MNFIQSFWHRKKAPISKEDTGLENLLTPNINPLFCTERICRKIA